ncbi:MAG: heme exporter protein CcmB [Gammaproteobacteria bacterium]
MVIFNQLLKREVLLVYRQPRDILDPLVFFIIVVTLFPVAFGADGSVLANYAVGVIWIAVLLAHVLTLDRLFQHDFADGTLEQLLLNPYPLHLAVCAKLLAHWFLTTVPLVLLVPVLALLLHMSLNQILWLCVSLLLGTPLLSCIGGIGAALTVGLKSRGALLALLILPLYIPILIFATGSVLAISSNASVLAPLAWLGAILALALPLSPLAITALLRININA